MGHEIATLVIFNYYKIVNTQTRAVLSYTEDVVCRRTGNKFYYERGRRGQVHIDIVGWVRIKSLCHPARSRLIGNTVLC